MSNPLLLTILAVASATVGVLSILLGWGALFIEESLQAVVLFALGLLALIASGVAWRRSGKRIL